MLKFRNLSICCRQTLVILAVSTAGLLMACAALGIYDVLDLRRELINEVSVIADVLSPRCSTTLDFDDPQTAEEILATLHSEPHIVSAYIYSREGEVFAAYRRPEGGDRAKPPPFRAAGHEWTGHELRLFRPIVVDGETIGTLCLNHDLRELDRRTARYLITAAVVLGLSWSAAFLLSLRFRRIVSNPILRLAQTLRTITREKNYSARAAREGNDELGELIGGLNDLLAQIQQRDLAQDAARENLERQVAGQTEELAAASRLLDAALELNADGILAADLSGRILRHNRKFAALWGIPPEKLQDTQVPAVMSLIQPLIKDPEGFAERNRVLKQPAAEETFIEIELLDGRVFEEYIKPLWLGGKCSGYVLGLRDATNRKRSEAERRRAEEALRESQALHQSLSDHLPAGVFRRDKEGRYVFVNAWFCRFKGLKWEEVIGKTPEEIEALKVPDPDSSKAAALARSDHESILQTGRPIERDEEYATPGGAVQYLHTVQIPVFGPDQSVTGSQGILLDVTHRKQSEQELEQLHRQLLDSSRQAGMAEVATSVLHNVGNVLNSVNVSASLVADHLKKSKGTNLGKVIALLDEHAADLGAFFSNNPKGPQLASYLKILNDQLNNERESELAEIALLRKNIEHIKDIVVMQQSYAKVSGVTETVDLRNLVEDALRMNGSALERHGVEVVRDYQDVPPVTLEKHKLLQILVNLIRNAKYACDDSGRSDKKMILQVARAETGVRISVTDNGIGIPAENLGRIFNHGFTTRKAGHGFGLHSGALVAHEMGGRLTAFSGGAGAGARFTVELPLQPPRK